MRLVDTLTLRPDSARHTRSGSTCSGETSVGVAEEWHLLLPNRPVLTVHDTRWDTGERDLVLYQPALVPAMPAALANLHNRRRAGIAPDVAHPGRLRIMAWLAWPGLQDRPTFRKSLTTEELAEDCGLQALRELAARPGVSLEPAFPTLELPPVDLDDPQDAKPLQHAVYFPEDDRETPALAFTLFRVVLTLHHIGWLPETPE